MFKIEKAKDYEWFHTCAKLLHEEGGHMAWQGKVSKQKRCFFIIIIYSFKRYSTIDDTAEYYHIKFSHLVVLTLYRTN